MKETKKLEKILTQLGNFEKVSENHFVYDTTHIRWFKSISSKIVAEPSQGNEWMSEFLQDVDENLIVTYLTDGSFKNKTMIIIGKIEMC